MKSLKEMFEEWKQETCQMVSCSTRVKNGYRCESCFLKDMFFKKVEKEAEKFRCPYCLGGGGVSNNEVCPRCQGTGCIKAIPLEKV